MPPDTRDGTCPSLGRDGVLLGDPPKVVWGDPGKVMVWGDSRSVDEAYDLLSGAAPPVVVNEGAEYESMNPGENITGDVDGTCVELRVEG